MKAAGIRYRSARYKASLSNRFATVSVLELKHAAGMVAIVAIAGVTLAAVSRHGGWIQLFEGIRSQALHSRQAAAHPPASGLPASAFTTINAPNAGNIANTGTFGLGINSAGTVTGFYLDNSNAAHGLLQAADGALTQFDAPDAGSGSKSGTFPLRINTSGEITGFYVDSKFANHGFLYSGPIH